MLTSEYSVEFNGEDYVIVFDGKVIGAFATSKEALDAKRTFTNRPHLSNFDKVPPAMREAKRRFMQE